MRHLAACCVAGSERSSGVNLQTPLLICLTRSLEIIIMIVIIIIIVITIKVEVIIIITIIMIIMMILMMIEQRSSGEAKRFSSEMGLEQ